MLTAEQLLQANSVEGQLPNEVFCPDTTAVQAKHRLTHCLRISESLMRCNLQGVKVNEQAVDLFPQIALRLASDAGNLIPLDRDLLRSGNKNSYWDITLSPGKVWSEPADGEWSRAALPFQLCNVFENDTHHGVATFLYDDKNISVIFFQIVAETKTFLCPPNLQAWGWLQARCSLLGEKETTTTIGNFQTELRDQLPNEPITHLLSDHTREHFERIETGFGNDSTLVFGLVIDNIIYSSPCETPVGAYPYPRSMMFGIWSATKTAFCSIACARMAQITGSDPREIRVAELLEEAQGNPDWSNITIGDCLNMASGIGTAATDAEPLNIFADYLLEESESQQSDEALASYNHYHNWFLAPSQAEKNRAAFSCPGYSWPAGSIARYRDQDLYVVSAALDALLKRIRGPGARIWDMLRDEVYLPASIHHAVKFHTVETDPSKEVPLGDAGLLLNMDHIARLGQLIRDRGSVGEEQLLEPKMLDEFFNSRNKKGLATGIQSEDGEVHYHGGIWHLPYKSLSGDMHWIPAMRGYGGQTIMTLPNGTTAFRFGSDSYATTERYDAIDLARLSDSIRPF